MRIKYILIGLLSLIFTIMMVGCGNENKRSDTSKNLTLNEVKEAVKKSNLELLPNDLLDYARLILNGEEPTSFRIGRPMADSIFKELLTVYIYNSKEDQEAGRLELEKMNLNEHEVIVYSYNNVLMLYWVDINANQKELFDSDLKNSVKLLMEL
ncbi:hypothetical protein J40TS1_08440 [Paenibacillus montaniterrae]|uniref:Uncharacterized protein n=1 Tax=Paenibacillus montaniterrae TaxID=429341 RepID=A0A920CSW1_9BACL|nr:hypothetical protein [Paenibacillus montaniterrae]GIP15202.1 hypothetical protein J40TS1_08440 [Paenibacillus montaniterrae]